MRAPEPPNMMPKPTSQKTGVPMQKSMRFFIRMLPVFLARVNPASHMANPACMKKTRAAPTRTQMVFTAEYVIIIPPSNKYKGADALPGVRPLAKNTRRCGVCRSAFAVYGRSVRPTVQSVNREMANSAS